MLRKIGVAPILLVLLNAAVSCGPTSPDPKETGSNAATNNGSSNNSTANSSTNSSTANSSTNNSMPNGSTNNQSTGELQVCASTEGLATCEAPPPLMAPRRLGFSFRNDGPGTAFGEQGSGVVTDVTETALRFDFDGTTTEFAWEGADLRDHFAVGDSIDFSYDTFETPALSAEDRSTVTSATARAEVISLAVEGDDLARYLSGEFSENRIRVTFGDCPPFSGCVSSEGTRVRLCLSPPLHFSLDDAEVELEEGTGADFANGHAYAHRSSMRSYVSAEATECTFSDEAYLVATFVEPL